MTLNTLKELEGCACAGVGSCAGMFTANSMNCLSEVLGLALPYNGTIPAIFLAWGLVNRVVPAEQLNQQATMIARLLAQGPVHAMGLAKRAFNKAVLGNLEQVLDYEGHLQDIASKNQEHKEGVQAFIEKRLAKFS